MITRFIVLLITFWITTAVLAQGTINFANAAAGVSAAVFNSAGDPCEGAAYWAQLYAEVDSSLTAIGDAVNFRTGNLAGFFLGGIRDIPGVVPGREAQVQVRVWRGDYFDFEAAYAAWWYQEDPAAEIGWSYGNDDLSNLDVTFGVTTGGGSLPPGNLVNLRSFNLVRTVPEPSTFALAILGTLALIACRPRRRAEA